MPGTASPAGRTSTRTGSDAHMRSWASWLARALRLPRGSSTASMSPPCLEEAQVSLPFPVGDQVVVLLPLPILHLDEDLLEWPEHLIDQGIRLEGLHRLEER